MSTNTKELEMDKEIFATANIIVAGITGAGKSTLINAVFGKEFAATGKGRPITQEIREYKSPEVPVKIWDSVGFEIGNDSNGVSKTITSIKRIKETIKEQSAKDNTEHIHAIWYCINQGSGRYQQTEADFVKELHSVGVPFIIVITQCTDPDDEFAKSVDKLNRQNGITDIPVIEVLAQDKKYRNGSIDPAFGLENLVNKTLEMLPVFIKSSFIAGQIINTVLKREECEKIIMKYERFAESGFWDKIPVFNIVSTDQKFKKMLQDIFRTYNHIISEDGCKKIKDDISKVYTTDLAYWCIVPSRFTVQEKKLKKLMDEIKNKGADGLELKERNNSYFLQSARLITFYGYTLLCAVEDVWEMIKNEKIRNLEEDIIPKIREKIEYYFGKRRE